MSRSHGTYFWVDPKEKLLALLMIQNPFDGSGLVKSAHYRHEMRNLVYQAMTRTEVGSINGASTQ